jgi:hypothetical protein
MLNIKPKTLKEMGARYIFCLMNEIVVTDNSCGPQSIVHVIPKYTIGWTIMEISHAPETATIPFSFLSGTKIVQANVQILDLKLIEKI